MKIKALGKFIDSTAIKNLMVQGEKNADKIIFEIDRYYNGSDISDLIFIIKGITSLNHLAEQILEKNIFADTIELKWQINSDFTAEAGELLLEIRGITNLETDTEENIVIKYTVSPVEVRKSAEDNLPSPDVIQNTLNTLHIAENNINDIYEKICSASVKTPYILNGVWWIYDSENMKYTNTGISAYDSSEILTSDITGITNISVILKNNTEFRYINSALENLVIKTGTDSEDENFISSVIFKASANGINISFDFDFEYVHDILFPSADKQYCMIFFYDGFGIKCAWYEV